VNTQEIYDKLATVDHSRTQRNLIANFLLDHPEHLRSFLEVCFKSDDPLSQKACWAVEYAAKQDLNTILPHVDYLCAHLHVLKMESCLRPMAKMCELLMLAYFKEKNAKVIKAFDSRQLDQIAEVCFDWLIGDHKVATRAHSMTCLLLVGEVFDWIHPELKVTLERGYAQGSAAYQARARHTLAKLK
jgi:hypothetical protein